MEFFLPRHLESVRLIVAGSRTFNDEKFLFEVLDSIQGPIVEIVSGNAEGADKLGEKYAKARGIDLVIFPANWKKHGKAAGPIRNEKMAKYANAAVVFWDGKSTGSQNMIRLMENNNKWCLRVTYDSKDA